MTSPEDVALLRARLREQLANTLILLDLAGADPMTVDDNRIVMSDGYEVIYASGTGAWDVRKIPHNDLPMRKQSRKW